MTFIFFLPRLLPSDPVEAMLGKIQSQGQYMEQAQVDALRSSLTDAFGLKGSLAEQYGRFMKRVLLTGDFGPSLAMYPTPVRQLILEVRPRNDYEGARRTLAVRARPPGRHYVRLAQAPVSRILVLVHEGRIVSLLDEEVGAPAQ